MRLSTRNQLTGTVASIEVGSVMTIVKVEELGLEVGAPVTALIKATEVMLGVED